MELDQMRGDLDAEFHRKFLQFCVQVCARLIAQPKQLALRLAHKTAVEVEAELTQSNQTLVAEFAAGQGGLTLEEQRQIAEILARRQP